MDFFSSLQPRISCQYSTLAYYFDFKGSRQNIICDLDVTTSYGLLQKKWLNSKLCMRRRGEGVCWPEDSMLTLKIGPRLKSNNLNHKQVNISAIKLLHCLWRWSFCRCRILLPTYKRWQIAGIIALLNQIQRCLFITAYNNLNTVTAYMQQYAIHE